MPLLRQVLIRDLALAWPTTSDAGRAFLAASIAAVPVGLMLWGFMPPGYARAILQDPWWLFSFLIWQPLLEELLFRGAMFGLLQQTQWGPNSRYGISLANLSTAIAFSAFHLVHHSIPWALAVFVPGLLFGYLRERYASIWPAVALHIGYNGIYLLAGSGLGLMH